MDRSYKPRRSTYARLRRSVLNSNAAMPRGTQTRVTRGILVTLIVLAVYFLYGGSISDSAPLTFGHEPVRPERHPPLFEIPHPQGRARHIPKIQTARPAESARAKAVRLARLDEVRETFLHAWKGYKDEAWTHDELQPISGGYKTPFCGWAATLVDSLDTLWIMGLYDEFDLAVKEVHNIDFTAKEGCQINLFETTIRHLGGFLAAYDISGGQKKYEILLEKAVELGEVLYSSFDTPNRMPTPHYIWSATDPNANDHLPSQSVVVAVLGSLTLEFTRLTQLTHNPKYYSAVQTVMNELEKWQMETTIPGLWPAIVDATKYNESIQIGSPFKGGSEVFTLGALADSTYEYLGKEYMLLGGRSPQYRSMYEKFVGPARTNLIFRPMTVGNKDILIAGHVDMAEGGRPQHQATLEHLTCFTGGMFAIGGRIFERPDDVELGRKLTDGCIWAYQSTATGIMPETFTAIRCLSEVDCPWDEQVWFKHVDPGYNPDDEGPVRQTIMDSRLSPGFASVGDRRYLLRPEAIESVFMMHRITAEPAWAEAGWDMFTSIAAHTRTRLAHSAVDDVTAPSPRRVNEMESFWLAETLKYFYLLYSDWDVVDLDEYVL